MKVRVKNSIADMCKALIDMGQSFKVKNNCITGESNGLYNFTAFMIENLGKEITLDSRGVFEDFNYSPYMYDIIEPTYKPFESVFEIPTDAWFRTEGSPRLDKLLGFNSYDGEMFFPYIENAMSFQKLLDDYEMSTDGKTWTPAGVEE